MTEEDIHFIIEKDKWPFKLMDMWDRYLVLLFPIALLFISTSMLIGTYATDSRLFGIIFFILVSAAALYIAYVDFNRIQSDRTFYTINCNSSGRNFIKEIFKQLNWPLIEENSGYIVAHTKATWSSWGEVITIIFNGELILFNSRPKWNINGNSNAVNFWKFYNILTKQTAHD
jgi:hypothetical protein